MSRSRARWGAHHLLPPLRIVVVRRQDLVEEHGVQRSGVVCVEFADIVGLEAFRKHNDNMFQGLEKVDWINKRQFAIGQVVINERIDEFYPFAGSKIPRMRFQVTGYFLIEDGKIRIWRDFSYPGSKQLIEPAPKA